MPGNERTTSKLPPLSDGARDDIKRLTEILDALAPENAFWLIGAVDTKEASEITGVPSATLVTLRSKGGGPQFFKPTPRSVRYFRMDLYQWMLAGGLKASTSDPGLSINLQTAIVRSEARND